jgi:hypothetical protein
MCVTSDPDPSSSLSPYCPLHFPSRHVGKKPLIVAVTLFPPRAVFLPSELANPSSFLLHVHLSASHHQSFVHITGFAVSAIVVHFPSELDFGLIL